MPFEEMLDAEAGIASSVEYNKVVANVRELIARQASVFLDEIEAEIDVASVSFEDIPSDFRRLRIMAFTQTTDTASVPRFLFARFNDDDDDNYRRHRLQAQGDTPAANADTDATSLVFGRAIRVSAQTWAASDATLHGYSDPTVRPLLLGEASGIIDGTSNWRTEVHSGRWNDASAVEKVTFFPSVGDIAAGSRFTLYGER